MIKSIDYFHYKLASELGSHTLKSINNIQIAYNQYDMRPFLHIHCDSWLTDMCNSFRYGFSADDNRSQIFHNALMIGPIEHAIFRFLYNDPT